MTTYSNPRTRAVIDNWPNGKHRVQAVFEIERHPGGAERAIRTTTGAPKKLTYADQMRIVDGDDGRTYIAALSKFGDMITIWRGDMKFNHEVVHGTNPRYAEIMSLFD